MNPTRIDPEIMHGTPCFAGTRVPVKLLFETLGRGRSIEDFFRGFPTVERGQVADALEAALELLVQTAEVVEPEIVSAGAS